MRFRPSRQLVDWSFIGRTLNEFTPLSTISFRDPQLGRRWASVQRVTQPYKTPFCPNEPNEERSATSTKEAKSIEDIPGPGGVCSLPYIGSMFLYYPFTHHTMERSHLMFHELHQRYGPLVKFRKGAKWSVILFHPDLIEEAIANEGVCPVRPSLSLLNIYSERTGNKKSISQVHGQAWLDMRRPVQDYLLQPSNIKQYTPALNQVANDLVCSLKEEIEKHSGDSKEHIKGDNNTYVADLMLRYAIESSAIYCINLRLGCLKTTTIETADYNQSQNAQQSSLNLQNNEDAHSLSENERDKLMGMIKVYMRCIGESLYTFPFYTLLRTRLYREFEEASIYISSICHKRVKSVMSALQTAKSEKTVPENLDEKSGRPNLLQFLVTDGRMDIKTCVSLLGGFFSTATDNVSNSLTILLWLLAKHPLVQDRLREEITSCVTSNTEVSSEVMGHMPYLKACLKESHRLVFPTPLGTLRILPKDMIFNGYKIPQGTTIYFGHSSLCKSEEYFEQPEKYIPSRWLRQRDDPREVALQRKQSLIALPFGHGKRNCLGRRLAENQIYLAVIKILQHYSLSLPDPNEELDIVHKVTAMSSKPLDIRFHPLTTTATSSSYSL